MALIGSQIAASHRNCRNLNENLCLIRMDHQLFIIVLLCLIWHQKTITIISFCHCMRRYVQWSNYVLFIFVIQFFFTFFFPLFTIDLFFLSLTFMDDMLLIGIENLWNQRTLIDWRHCKRYDWNRIEFGLSPVYISGISFDSTDFFFFWQHGIEFYLSTVHYGYIVWRHRIFSTATQVGMAYK